jgi:predicted SAM-dependent methyltransferase
MKNSSQPISTRIKHVLLAFRLYGAIERLKTVLNYHNRIKLKTYLLFKETKMRYKRAYFGFWRAWVVRKYLGSNNVRKLQLGSGANVIGGWLCTDLWPARKEILFLDVKKPFKFDDNVFDYIFCEHMIEHLSFTEAEGMLKECRRILKKGGKIRISTPDLQVYVALFSENKTALQKQFIDWVSENWLQRGGITSKNEAFVINLMMSAWGHQFLYDKKTLEHVLGETGFTEVRQFQNKISNDEHLAGLETHEESLKSINFGASRYEAGMFKEMNNMASLTVEAVKR